MFDVMPARPARLPASSQLISRSTCHSLDQMVGDTPVVWTPDVLGTPGRGFWAKLEGHNPGGIKDRPGLYLVQQARERGRLRPGAPVIESTSGTLGLGLALAGQIYEHPVTLVTDPGMEPAMRYLLAAYGARVDIVERPHPSGGWQQARRDRVAQLLDEQSGGFCPDQYHNPDNVDAYQPLALELAAQLGRIDVLVCSVGTGGHSAGVSRVLREFFPHLRLVLICPMVGLALLAADFRWVCAVSALIFLGLLLLQSRTLPTRSSESAESRAGMLADWRQVITNRPFLLFSLAMVGSYVLNFQVYLALPMQVRQTTGSETGVTALFAVSGLLTVIGQVRLTAWVKNRWTPSGAIVRGLWLMAAAFLPLAVTAGIGRASPGPVSMATHLAPVMLSTVLLTVATMLVYPFEMTIIVSLAGPRLVGTYYGLYSTIAGIGIAAGNLLTGVALDAGRKHAMPALTWLLLTGTGALCACAVWSLGRSASLAATQQAPASARSSTTSEPERTRTAEQQTTG